MTSEEGKKMDFLVTVIVALAICWLTCNISTVNYC